MQAVARVHQRELLLRNGAQGKLVLIPGPSRGMGSSMHIVSTIRHAPLSEDMLLRVK